jgi:DNA helicase-2/ATP-dependent DNA helicase PcrA
MQKRTLILGPPGTGKTTRLLDLVDKYINAGTSVNKIGFISFTRKAVNEARDRAAKRFRIGQDQFTYFRTIHSLAFRQTSMASADVMTRTHYKQLGTLLGLKITGSQRQDQAIYELNKGDQFVFIESLARLCCESLEDAYSRLNPDFSIQELELFQETLKAFKKAHYLVDFTDMLERFHKNGYKPFLDVLFVDEAQDLAPLQWHIVEQLSQRSGQIYIAGDDDQAIFRWSGADTDYFISLADASTVEILEQSYRLPKKVYKFSLGILDNIGRRNVKKFKPTKDTGSLTFVSRIEEINLDAGEWLIMLRNGYLIKEVADYVRMLGIPYESIWYHPKNDEGLKAALLWERLRNDKEITIQDAKLIFSFMSDNNVSGNWKKALKGRANNTLVSMGKLRLWCNINTTEIWHKALDKISIEDREYYIAARRRDESFTKEPRIKITTIHGAKGGESENVIVFTDMSLRTYNGMIDNPDDESRVFYVAVTRTKNNLYIVSPDTPYYFPF